MADQRQLAKLDGLAELAKRDGVDIKPTLLRVMTDFYIQKPTHTADQERRFTEIALMLLDHVDAETRTAIAEKFEHYAAPPPAVAQRLLRDAIDTSFASPVTVAPFAGGKAAAAELSELFFGANAAERRLILLSLPYAALPPADPPKPAAANEAIGQLETAALTHNTEIFAREVERALGISRKYARRLIEDESGEPMLVAGKALAMAEEVLQRILLCLHPVVSQSVQRIYELSALYGEMERDAALRLLALWRASQQPAAPHAAEHQPQYWHVKKGSRPAPAERTKIAWEEHAKAEAKSA